MNRRFLANVSKRRRIVAQSARINRLIKRVHPSPLAINRVASLILPPKQQTQRRRQNKHEETKPTTNPHPGPIIRCLRRGKHPRPQNRATLSHGGENPQAARTLGIGAGVVGHPRQNDGHGDEDQDAQEEGKVAHPGGRRDGHDEETYCGDEGGDGDEDTAGLESVAEEGDADDDEVAEEVGWRGETVRLDAAEGTHLADYRGEENWQRGERNVTSEIHQRGKVICRQYIVAHYI